MTLWTPKIEKILQGEIDARVNSDDDFVAMHAFMERKTDKYSGLLPSWGDDHLRIVNNVAGGEAPYRRIKCNETNEIPYKLRSYGLKKVIVIEDLCNYEFPHDAKRDSAMMLESAMKIAKEHRVASALQDPAVITQNIALTAPTDKYNDYMNSKPIENFLNARIALNRATGATQRDIIAFMNYDVAETLRRHPSLVENNKYTSNMNSGLSYDQLADAMGVRKVYVGNAQYVAGNVPQNTGYQSIWGNHITFTVSPNGGHNFRKVFGYKMTLRKRPNMRLRSVMQDEPEDSIKMMISEIGSEIIANTGASYLISDVL